MTIFQCRIPVNAEKLKIDIVGEAKEKFLDLKIAPEECSLVVNLHFLEPRNGNQTEVGRFVFFRCSVRSSWRISLNI